MEKKTTITERAALQRINRKLAHDEKRLSYGPNPWCGGHCYRLVDVRTNTITDSVEVDALKAFGRAFGVIAESEAVVSSR